MPRRQSHSQSQAQTRAQITDFVWTGCQVLPQAASQAGRQNAQFSWSVVGFHVDVSSLGQTTTLGGRSFAFSIHLKMA